MTEFIVVMTFTCTHNGPTTRPILMVGTTYQVSTADLEPLTGTISPVHGWQNVCVLWKSRPVDDS